MPPGKWDTNHQKLKHSCDWMATLEVDQPAISITDTVCMMVSILIFV